MASAAQIHNANNPLYVHNNSFCATCERIQESRRRALDEEAAYARGDHALRDLRTCGVPPIPVYSMFEQWRPGRFRSRNLIKHFVPEGFAWILGPVEWEYDDGGPYGGSVVCGPWLTALLNVDNYNETWASGRLVRVSVIPPHNGCILNKKPGRLTDNFSASDAVRRIVSYRRR